MNINKEYYEFLTNKIREIVVKELNVNNGDGPRPDLSQAKAICASTEVDLETIDNPLVLNNVANELINQINKKIEKDNYILLTIPEVHLDESMFKMKQFGVYSFIYVKKIYEVPSYAVLDSRAIFSGSL